MLWGARFHPLLIDQYVGLKSHSKFRGVLKLPLFCSFAASSQIFPMHTWDKCLRQMERSWSLYGSIRFKITLLNFWLFLYSTYWDYGLRLRLPKLVSIHFLLGLLLAPTVHLSVGCLPSTPDWVRPVWPLCLWCHDQPWLRRTTMVFEVMWEVVGASDINEVDTLSSYLKFSSSVWMTASQFEVCFLVDIQIPDMVVLGSFCMVL